MSLGFVHPALLWGLLAAAIPLLVHLFFRRRPRPTPFPAIEFILRARRETQRRLRLKKVLLFTARTLILAAVAIAIARPRAEQPAAAGAAVDRGPRATAEYTHRRVFDYPATFHSKIEYGRDKQAVDAEVSTHPGEHFYRNLIGLQVERQQTDLDDVLSQSLRVGRTQDTNLRDIERKIGEVVDVGAAKHGHNLYTEDDEPPEHEEMKPSGGLLADARIGAGLALHKLFLAERIYQHRRKAFGDLTESVGRHSRGRVDLPDHSAFVPVRGAQYATSRTVSAPSFRCSSPQALSAASICSGVSVRSSGARRSRPSAIGRRPWRP